MRALCTFVREEWRAAAAVSPTRESTQLEMGFLIGKSAAAGLAARQAAQAQYALRLAAGDLARLPVIRGMHVRKVSYHER